MSDKRPGGHRCRVFSFQGQRAEPGRRGPPSGRNRPRTDRHHRGGRRHRLGPRFGRGLEDRRRHCGCNDGNRAQQATSGGFQPTPVHLVGARRRQAGQERGGPLRHGTRLRAARAGVHSDRRHGLRPTDNGGADGRRRGHHIRLGRRGSQNVVRRASGGIRQRDDLHQDPARVVGTDSRILRPAGGADDGAGAGPRAAGRRPSADGTEPGPSVPRRSRRRLCHWQR